MPTAEGRTDLGPCVPATGLPIHDVDMSRGTNGPCALVQSGNKTPSLPSGAPRAAAAAETEGSADSSGPASSLSITLSLDRASPPSRKCGHHKRRSAFRSSLQIRSHSACVRELAVGLLKFDRRPLRAGTRHFKSCMNSASERYPLLSSSQCSNRFERRLFRVQFSGGQFPRPIAFPDSI